MITKTIIIGVSDGMDCGLWIVGGRGTDDDVVVIGILG